MSQLTRAKKTKVASKSRLNFGLPHDDFFSFRNSKYEFFDAVRPEQRIVLRAEKIAEMGGAVAVQSRCSRERQVASRKENWF